MALIVQKYGGTSVGTFERIKKVAEHIKERIKNEDRIIAVVSAMGNQTDEMNSWVRQFSSNPDPREKDLLLSTGEIQSATLLAIALNEIGVKAKSMTGFQAGLTTTPDFGKAKMIRLQNQESIREIAEHTVLVITGFQGLDLSGEITTLGRGGSDATAVGIAYEVGAELCEIYTDVDGVFAVDPRIVPNAKRIKNISPLHMIRMGRNGAGVMMPRSVEIGMKHKIPIRVMMSPSIGVSRGGTLIADEPYEVIEKTNIENSAALAIKKVFGVVISRIKNVPGQASMIFKVLSDLSVSDSAQGLNLGESASITLLVEKDKAEEIKKRLGVLENFGGQIEITEKLAIITLVDENMIDDAGYFFRMSNAVASKEINILGFSSADRAIAIIVEEKNLKVAAKALAEEFSLTK